MDKFNNTLYHSVRRLLSAATVVAALCACPALTSCSDDSSDAPSLNAQEGCFISVEVPMLGNESRAPGDDTFNEFTVKTIDFFFYQSAGFTESSSAAYHKRVNVDFVGSEEIQVNIPKKDMDGIFGTNGSSCILYAVANYPTGISATATPRQLKNLPLGPDFETTQVQESFAMISNQASVTFDRTAKKATGSITLTRACAKLMLSLDIPASIEVTNTVTDPGSGSTTDTKVTYISNPEAARVWISNGVKESDILMDINDDSSIETTAYYSNTFDTTKGNGASFSAIETTSRYKYAQSVPFYSYPNKWNPKGAEGVTTITFQIPWHKEGDSNQIITYYSITVNPDECRLLRNYFYDMRLAVSRLGSTDVTKPVDMNVEWNYELPWNKHDLPTNIKDIRYLLLNNNDYNETTSYPTTGASLTGWYVYEMNNETELQIPVSTSHKVKIDKVEMIWHDFKDNKNFKLEIPYSSTGGKENSYTSTDKYQAGTDYLGVDFDMATSMLNIKRELYDIKPEGNAAGQSQPTYTPMYINVYICHEDDPSYAQKIRIEQYPPIYISADMTSRYNGSITRFVNSSRSGSIYNNSTDIYLGSLHDDSDTQNFKNPQSYVISISKFNANEAKKYIIADPRVTTINNLPYDNEDWSARVADINGTQRRLSYYYPADNASKKQRYIAPKFRIASQWGITLQLTRDGAIRRCASYQENGRPAGRWRVPTPAEIEFIATLSNKGFIPYLFGVGRDNPIYWCSTGGITVNNSTTNPSVTVNTNVSGNRSVRCVYDEWYWGADTLKQADKAKFVWGDRQRSTSGNVNKSINR